MKLKLEILLVASLTLALNGKEGDFDVPAQFTLICMSTADALTKESREKWGL